MHVSRAPMKKMRRRPFAVLSPRVRFSKARGPDIIEKTNRFGKGGDEPVILGLVLLLVLLLFLFPASARGETRLMVVTDLHYLAPELYAGSELFLRALQAGDGKITQQGEKLMQALTAEAKRRRPDALIVTGDLSFNGEKASHLRMAAWLGEIRAAGIPVWVIPGNHDIRSAVARAFSGNAWQYTEAVTEAEFARIYAPFLGKKEGNAGANLSYHVRVGERWILALADAACYRDGAQVFGAFTPDHAAWLSDTLASAQATGDRTITATHHSLIPHTLLARDSFVMRNNEAMLGLLKRFGVPLNLSGHLHIQHIARQGVLADAATGAFSVWPHTWAWVTLGEDGQVAYAAHPLSDDLLPAGFQEQSKAWFAVITREKNRVHLANPGIPAADVSAMLDYAARFNLAFFSGHYRREDPSWLQDRAYALWQHYGRDTFGAYLRLLMGEGGGDHLAWNGGKRG